MYSERALCCFISKVRTGNLPPSPPAAALAPQTVRSRPEAAAFRSLAHEVFFLTHDGFMISSVSTPTVKYTLMQSLFTSLFWMSDFERLCADCLLYFYFF